MITGRSPVGCVEITVVSDGSTDRTVERANRYRPQVKIIVFEKNPWNPGAMQVMKRIPFDRHAKPFDIPTAKAMRAAHGFCDVLSVRPLLYFPRWLSRLRFLEPHLATLPLGAQSYVLARKAPL